MAFSILLKFLIEVFGGYLFADFIIGIYHWFKDTYFTPFTPIIGKTLIWSSRLHHVRPRYVTEFSDKELFTGSAKWTLVWMGPLFFFVGLTPFWISVFLFISLNDVIHKYAHLLDHERPYWATILQKIFLFQSHTEHHTHHIDPHDTNYCPISPFINIILEKINFWKKLESTVENITGVKPRAKMDDFVEDDKYPGGIKFIQNS